MSRNSELADRICRRFCNGPEAETLGDIIDREVKNGLSAKDDRIAKLERELAALRAALEKHENAARENLISARIIEAENKGRNYGITRDARFILERAQAALAAGGAK